MRIKLQASATQCARGWRGDFAKKTITCTRLDAGDTFRVKEDGVRKNGGCRASFSGL